MAGTGNRSMTTVVLKALFIFPSSSFFSYLSLFSSLFVSLSLLYPSLVFFLFIFIFSPSLLYLLLFPFLFPFLFLFPSFSLSSSSPLRLIALLSLFSPLTHTYTRVEYIHTFASRGIEGCQFPDKRKFPCVFP